MRPKLPPSRHLPPSRNQRRVVPRTSVSFLTKNRFQPRAAGQLGSPHPVLMIPTPSRAIGFAAPIPIYNRAVVIRLELRHGLTSPRPREPDGCPASTGRRILARDVQPSSRKGADEGARFPQPLPQAGLYERRRKLAGVARRQYRIHHAAAAQRRLTLFVQCPRCSVCRALFTEELAGRAVDEMDASAGLADDGLVSALRIVGLDPVGAPMLNVQSRSRTSKDKMIHRQT